MIKWRLTGFSERGPVLRCGLKLELEIRKVNIGFTKAGEGEGEAEGGEWGLQ